MQFLSATYWKLLQYCHNDITKSIHFDILCSPSTITEITDEDGEVKLKEVLCATEGTGGRVHTDRAEGSKPAALTTMEPSNIV